MPELFVCRVADGIFIVPGIVSSAPGIVLFVTQPGVCESILMIDTSLSYIFLTKPLPWHTAKNSFVKPVIQ